MVSNEQLGGKQTWRRAIQKQLGFAAPFLAFAAKGEEPRPEPAPDKLMMDRLAIREVIDNWVLYRDAGDWERFRTRLAQRWRHGLKVPLRNSPR